MGPISPSIWAFLQAHQRILESKECLAALHDRNARAGKIVRAHIIPRSQLFQIAERGHVHAVPTRLTAVARMKHSGFDTQDIGAGQFSTLKCFCAHHDKMLFAPLEDKPLIFSPEQLTLLHYRAISAEAYQRRNQEDGAAVEARKHASSDPRRDAFYALFQIHSLAAETAEETLDRTERMLECSQYADIRAVVVRFNARPALLSVSAFRPLYDVTGKQLQDFTPESAYVGMHILIANNKPVFALTWLRGQRAAERFARSFCAQPRERLTTLAVQTAFEYAEHTCMRREWWLALPEKRRIALLKRVETANAPSIRASKSLSYRYHYDDWDCRNLDFVQ
jgi:hypothetical protein